MGLGFEQCILLIKLKKGFLIFDASTVAFFVDLVSKGSFLVAFGRKGCMKCSLGHENYYEVNNLLVYLLWKYSIHYAFIKILSFSLLGFALLVMTKHTHLLIILKSANTKVSSYSDMAFTNRKGQNNLQTI